MSLATSRRPRDEPPAAFTAAAESLAAARVHPDAIIRETTPPARIAPFAAALTIELGESASGRFVYLHDPAGQPAWAGHDRLVAFARVEIDHAMATDPMLTDVVWDWLAESFAHRDAGMSALGGTVTTTASRRYGSLAHLEPSQEVEVRCSWTPAVPGAPGAVAGLDLGPHLGGLVDALVAMCGLPPGAADITALP